MWFKGYDGDDRKSFVGQYYLTGDTVRLNEFGGIDFIGRADDVITTSGYRVGPFDVESTLLECEEVLESAVIGKPDPERTEVVKAFVVLKININQALHCRKSCNSMCVHAYRNMPILKKLNLSAVCLKHPVEKFSVIY